MSLRGKGKLQRQRATHSARALALIALRRWRKKDQFADAILADVLTSSGLIAADRAFVTELFYGILRNLTLLDYWVDAVRSGPLKNDVRDLLRLGIYQLLLLKTPEHAAVFETVELASKKTQPLVNALLRKVLREKAELLVQTERQDLSVKYSQPKFLIDRWQKNFGADNTASLCEWNNKPAPIYARINQLKLSIADFFLKYGGAHELPNQENFARLTEIPHQALLDGHCYVQDPSTAPACKLLDPKPDDTVLDACAAPGGKTGYLAELMKNRGTLVACDREPARLKIMQTNLDRLGVRNTRLFQRDWDENAVSQVLPITEFDGIMVDAPCSNTGVMRRRVDLRWRLRSQDFRQMQRKQLNILESIIPMLKNGGILVYSTCSIEPEENKELIQIVLQKFSYLQCVEQITLLPFRDRFDGAFAAKLVRCG